MVNGYTLREFTYKNCQYLTLGMGIAHKGTCTNSFHKTNVIVEPVILLILPEGEEQFVPQSTNKNLVMGIHTDK